MLFLVTHFVEVPSSRVPLAVIVLNDAIKRRSLPANLKCRMVIPSTGNYSASVWDATSAEELQQWIDGTLMDGIAHIAEIPEDFTYGLSLELTTARAAEKLQTGTVAAAEQVATSSKNTLDRINTTGARVIETVAEKLDRLDQRTHLITATREATSAAVGRVKQATDRALESEGVQKSLASISSSLQTASSSMGRAFSWVGSKVKGSFPSAASAGGAQPYSAFGQDGADTASSYDAVYSSSVPNYMPVSTNAARPSGDATDLPSGGGVWGTGAGAPAEEAVPLPHFTLQEEGSVSPQGTPSKDFGAEPEAPATGPETGAEPLQLGVPAQEAHGTEAADKEQLPVSAPVS